MAPADPSRPPPDPRPIVISGPSGVGKGTLYKKLFEAHPGVFALAVSHTTRNPRPGEQHGKDYYFVSHDEFEALVKADGFVEHAKFGGNRYGTSKATIEEQSKKGQHVVLDIEMEGVKQIKASKIPARFVFISPPGRSLAVLEERLRGRGTETESSIQKRLEQAAREMEYAFDSSEGSSSSVHDYVIFNDDLEKAFAELEEWVYQPPPTDVTSGKTEEGKEKV